jgi:uncharacterized membrane protein
MAYSRQPAASALRWMAKGWALFLRAPVPWSIVTVLYLLVGVALSLIPLLGPLVTALTWPGLGGGLFLTAHQIDQGRQPGPGVLFGAFTDAETLGPVLLLGLLPMAALLIGMLGLLALIGGAAGSGATMPPESAAIGGFLTGGLLAPVLGLTLAALVMAALVFAVPLVVFDGARVLPAVEQSILASLVNWRPLLLLGILYLLAAFVASIPLALGFLVLIPVTSGALYAAYVDIWGEPEDTPADV